MTDEQVTTPDEEYPETGIDPEWPRLALLRAMLADNVREPEGVPVTVQVGGKLVTGTAVDYGRWADALAGNEEPLHAVERADDEISAREIRHLNLIDVTLMNATGPVGDLNVAAWQIPLSHVEGWMLGRANRVKD